MSFFLTSAVFSKKSVSTVAMGLVLLALSVFGFCYALGVPDDHRFDLPNRLFFLALVGIAPLVVFIVGVAQAAYERGKLQAAIGFHAPMEQMQERLNAQGDFLKVITDYNPVAVTVYNKANEYWFLNAAAAKELGEKGHNASGRKPSYVMGPERGRKLEKYLDDVRKTGQSGTLFNQSVDDAGKTRFLQTSYQVLPAFGDFPGGIMAYEEDVTTILVERERRESMLRQMLSTLVSVVDRRDPYAAGHSVRVGQLSRVLAEELLLSEKDIEAAEIAGSLMNFGKVLVSRAILTKTQSLTPVELQRIRDGIMVSADIVSRIDFGAPVVPTLRQILERVDGSGEPQGLKGEAILLTARIVAVANAFVALVSPRAYRPGADIAVAMHRIIQDEGKAFDARVIAALATYIKKHAARLDWLTTSKVN